MKAGFGLALYEQDCAWGSQILVPTQAELIAWVEHDREVAPMTPVIAMKSSLRQPSNGRGAAAARAGNQGQKYVTPQITRNSRRVQVMVEVLPQRFCFGESRFEAAVLCLTNKSPHRGYASSSRA
jgi:hypothetical protein